MRLAAVLGAVLALLAPAFVGAGTTAPALRVADLTPFALRGLRFHAYERVTLVVKSNGRHVKTVVAGAKGDFAVRFPSISLHGCYSYIVRATGNRGSHASLKHITAC